MKIDGTETLHAPRDRVWAALTDPAVLVRTIPGCERLEAVGADRYRMTVTAGVAAIKGTYLGDVAITDPEPPSAFTLLASGAGAPGTVSADVKVTLDDTGDGTTALTYRADAVVGGPVGGVGQRVLAGVAKRTAGEFFRAVEAALAAPAPQETRQQARQEALATDVVVGAPAGPAGTPEVFARPVEGGGAGRNVRVDVRDQLPGVLAGAAIALIGVWVGARVGGRR